MRWALWAAAGNFPVCTVTFSGCWQLKQTSNRHIRSSQISTNSVNAPLKKIFFFKSLCDRWWNDWKVIWKKISLFGFVCIVYHRVLYCKPLWQFLFIHDSDKYRSIFEWARGGAHIWLTAEAFCLRFLPLLSSVMAKRIIPALWHGLFAAVSR